MTTARLKGPWRWDRTGGAPRLVSAGSAPFSILDGSDIDGDKIDPVVEVLTAAAPELEASLRWALDAIAGYGDAEGFWPWEATRDAAGNGVDPQVMQDVATALLARIDAARVKGARG